MSRLITMSDFKILGLYKGTPEKLKETKLVSSIGARKSQENLSINIDQILGDRVQDLKHHGGEDRVVHFYPVENYEYWKSIYPDYKDSFLPSTIGENICSIGLIESKVCIGDIYQIGEVHLEVTEPRIPCGFIDQNYGIKSMHKEVEKLARCGWMCRVLKPGFISVKDNICLLKKGDKRFSVESCLIYCKVKEDKTFMKDLEKYPPLSSRYREMIQKKLLS